MERKLTQTTRLATYLDAVRSGKLLNYSGLVQELVKKSVPEPTISSCFSAKLVRPKKFRVEILDEENFNQLFERFSGSTTSDREHAALYGDSHRAPVSGSYLLLRKESLPHPIVVWFEGETFSCPTPQSQTAILIENLENYIAIDLLPDLLKMCGISVEMNQTDVIYGSGNQITNQLHQPFLKNYKHVFCLFDIDPGALKMYQSLKKMLPAVDLQFSYPKDIIHRLNTSERKMSVAERADLLTYTGISPEIDELIQFMRKSGSKLEQETYLYFSTT